MTESYKLDLVVAGTAGAVLMVESEADLLSEEEMLGAVVFGRSATSCDRKHQCISCRSG